MATAALRLQHYGHNSLLVWVLEDNPYRKFYESLIGSPVGKKEVEIGGRQFKEVAFGWANMKIFVEISESINYK